MCMNLYDGRLPVVREIPEKIGTTLYSGYWYQDHAFRDPGRVTCVSHGYMRPHTHNQ